MRIAMVVVFLALGVLCRGAEDTPKPKKGDWTQWGGDDHRNMVSDETGLPDSFDPGKAKEGTEEIDMSTTRNVRWVAKLGSQTYGNPTVADGRVFIGTNNESPRNPAHTGDRGILLCLDENTGALQWQLVVPKLASGKVNDWEYLGIMSSPTVDGEKVYVVTNRCEVLCLDVKGMADGNQGPFEHEGHYMDDPLILYNDKKLKEKPKIEPGKTDADILWQFDMMDEMGVFPHNASNCSVVIHGDLLYTNTSNGQDWSHVNIPSENAPSFLALNKHTGEFAGEDDIAQGPRILHGLWSNPSLAQVGDKTLLFYGGGDGWLYAFDGKPVKDDESTWLKHVWKVDANLPGYREKDGKKIKYPTYPGPSEINATPVYYDGKVYVAIGQDPEHGEGLGNLVCVNAADGKLVWNYDQIMRSISTVAIKDGLLFTADFSGNIYCIDAAKGTPLWKHETGAHIWGSPLVADGKLYIGNEDGDLYVFAAAKEKKLLNANAEGEVTNFGSPIYSTPIAANGVLYVGTQTHLYALEAAPKP